MLIIGELTHHYELADLCDWLTVFADDFHAGRVITTPQDFHDSLQFLGRLLDTLAMMGMTVNLTKSKVLIRLQGSKHRQILNKHIARTAEGHLLIIPGYGGTTHTIPVASEVGYLGIIISYYNASARTLTHRLSMARVA